MLEPVDPTDETKGFFVDTPDAYLIFPDKEYADAEAFFTDFPPASIPFFGDFTIQPVPDKDEEGNPNICYLSARALLASVSTASLALFYTLL